jgi:FkbM family methyltransferase
MNIQMGEETRLKRLAQWAAPPITRAVTSPLLYKPFRYALSYMHFLLGQGGGGAILDWEVRAATRVIYRHPSVVIDGGANNGHWSQRLWERLPDAVTIQCEPLPECQRAIARLHIPNSRLVPCALGKEEGAATFYRSISRGSGSSSMYKRNDTWGKGATFEEITVAVTTIDALMCQYEIEFIDFLKMDIEGHEWCALCGASSALKRRQIGALSFEFSCSDVNSRTFFRDFWELLTRHGYRVCRIVPGGRLLTIGEYYEDLEYFRGNTNYVAVLTHHPYA